MRKTLLCGVAMATVAAAGFAAMGPADAADIAPVYKAAPAPTALPWNWTGFYLGAHIGGVWGTKDAFDPFDGKSAGTGTINGYLGGVQAGYNVQYDWVVVGIEGDFSGANVTGANIFSGPFCCGNTGRAKVDWFSTLTGRAGVTVDHALLYVKGGVAWAGDKFYNGPTSATAIFSTNVTRIGWTGGAGIEYAIRRNWSAKLEYDYMDFGTHRVSFVCSGACDPTFDVDFRQRVHVVKAGLNYRFDWAPPIAARY